MLLRAAEVALRRCSAGAAVTLLLACAPCVLACLLACRACMHAEQHTACMHAAAHMPWASHMHACMQHRAPASHMHAAQSTGTFQQMHMTSTGCILTTKVVVDAPECRQRHVLLVIPRSGKLRPSLLSRQIMGYSVDAWNLLEHV